MNVCRERETQTTAETRLAICDNCGEPHAVALNPNAERDCHDPALGSTLSDETDPGHFIMAEHNFRDTGERCNGSGLCPMTTSWLEAATQ